MRLLFPATTLVVALIGASGLASAQEAPGEFGGGPSEFVANCPADAIATSDEGLSVDAQSADANAPSDEAQIPDFGDLCRDGRDPRCSQGNPVPDAPSFAPGADLVRYLDAARLVVPGAVVAPIRTVVPARVESRVGPSGYAHRLDEPPRPR